MSTLTTDVIVVGGGLSGLCLAHSLAQRNISSIVVDRKATYPDNFRADKLEYNQIAALRALNLDQFVLPKSEPVGDILSYSQGKLSTLDTIDQYGFAYAQTVNNLRENLPSEVHYLVAHISSVSVSEHTQTLTLKDEQQISGKLLVIATGGNHSISKLLNMQRSADASLWTLNFGFDVASTNSSGFDFRGLNYHAENPASGVDYLTLFPIGNVMRANIFTRWPAKDARALAMRNNPVTAMQEYFERLLEFTGAMQLASKVQMFPTEFYRMRNVLQPGVVVIADEYQSVSPATGKGLDKLTTDLNILSEKKIPAWLAKGRISKTDVATFYNNPEKKETDLKAISDWVFYRDNGLSSGPSLGSRAIFKFKSTLNWF